MTGFALVPSRTALINVDLQRCFVEGGPLASPDGLAMVERVNRLARVCRQAGALVVHTRVAIKPDRSNAGVMTELMPDFIIGLVTEGAASAELHDALEVDPADIILGKPRYGAFHGTDLEQILRSRGIDTVIITGIATNICCETTAREASQHDFRVFFVSDGTATMEMGGVPAEDLQRATCASLGQVFAEVVTLDDILARIAGAAPAAEQAEAAPVEQDNAAVVRRFWDLIWNKGELEAISELVDDDFTNFGIRRPGGHAGVRRIVTAWRTAFPDLHYEILEEIACGDTVVHRVMAQGTHLGELPPGVGPGRVLGAMPPTGRSFEADQIHVHQVRGGKITGHDATRNDLLMLSQLGLLPGIKPVSEAAWRSPLAPGHH